MKSMFMSFKYLCVILWALVSFGTNAFCREFSSTQEELISAAADGNDTKVEAILSKRLDPNFRSSYGTSPLVFAVEKGHLQVSKTLLRHGADVNFKDSNGCTPLYRAVHKDRLEIVTLLIASGAKINEPCRDGRTPMFQAVGFKENIEILKFLLTKGATITPVETSGKTVLHRAAYGKNLEAIKILVGKGADINAMDNEGNTPLGHMLRRNNFEIVDFLVKNGANVSIVNKSKKTLLHEAVTLDDTRIAKFLLAHGLKTDAVDDRGATPLHYAGQIPMLELLIANGAKIDAQMNDGTSLLHEAISWEKKAFAGYLIKKGANVNITNIAGDSPLHLASTFAMEPVDLINLLIAAGADVNLKNKLGQTPLHKAVAASYVDGVKLLIEKKANLNVKDNHGNTPYILAMKGGMQAITDMLKTAGADVSGAETIASDKDAPPNPYIDKGACPFECCKYREWSVEKDTGLYKDINSSVVIEQLKKRTNVTALTGEVHTIPGIVNVKSDHGSYKAGDKLYVLTYEGEGIYKVSYKRKILSDSDVYEFIDDARIDAMDHGKSVQSVGWGEVERAPQSIWWIQIKTKNGRVGWTKDSRAFDNQDACG